MSTQNKNTDDASPYLSAFPMTLRDRFALQAMPKAIDYWPRGIKNRFLSWFGGAYAGPSVKYDIAAKRCYEFADAMLAERKKNKP